MPYLDDLEQRLYRWLIEMARIGYGQSKNDSFNHIQVIIKRLKWETKFVDGCLGEQWYRLFLKHFPNLKLHQAQLLSHQHAGISHNALNVWYHELFKYLEEMGNLSILNEPLRIFNADETGFPMAPWPRKVLAGKGDPNVYQQGSSNKSQITVLMTSNAVTLYIPPLVVYPGCNFHQTFIENFYSHFLMAIFGHSTNGWMDADLFKKWLEESCIPKIDKACIPKPVLLIIDGAKCHICLPISELCNENNIILYMLLPNATYLIQPLDLSLMGSIKTNYQECIHKWLQNNLGGIYDKNAFIKVFAKVYKKAANIENAVSSFHHAGIFLWDPTKVDDKKLAPAELFKKDDPIPDVNTSVNEGKGEAKNHCEEEGSGSTQAEQKLPEKEIKASGSCNRNNKVMMTTNPDGLINEIVIDGVKYQMVLLGDGDAQPKSKEVLKKTPVGSNETKKVIDEMLTIPSVQKKKTSSCHVLGILRCISSKKFQDIMKKKEQEKKELEDGKEECKRKHIANAEEKKRCQEEAKKK